MKNIIKRQFESQTQLQTRTQSLQRGHTDLKKNQLFVNLVLVLFDTHQRLQKMLYANRLKYFTFCCSLSVEKVKISIPCLGVCVYRVKRRPEDREIFMMKLTLNKVQSNPL